MGKKPRQPDIWTPQMAEVFEERTAIRRKQGDVANTLAPQIETQIERLIQAPRTSPTLRSDSTLGMTTRRKMMKELQSELVTLETAGPGKAVRIDRPDPSVSLSAGDPSEGFIAGKQSEDRFVNFNRGRGAKLDKDSPDYEADKATQDIIDRYSGARGRLALETGRLPRKKRAGTALNNFKRSKVGVSVGETTSRMVMRRRRGGRKRLAGPTTFGPSTSLGF